MVHLSPPVGEIARAARATVDIAAAAAARRTVMAKKKKNSNRGTRVNDALAWAITFVPALLAAMAAFWNTREQGLLDDGLTGKGKGSKKGKGSRKRSV
jgi:hypothetical protein